MSRPIRSSDTGTRALGAGMTLAVSVGLFAYGGLWLDGQIGTRPWMLLLGVLLGTTGGILHLIRVLAPEQWPFGKLPSKDQPSNDQPTRKEPSDEDPKPPA